MNFSTPENISNSLRKYRKARGLKQKDVAAILGLRGAGRISRWESGASLPTVTNMLKIAALYHVLADALYDDRLRVFREEMVAREIRYRETHKRNA